MNSGIDPVQAPHLKILERETVMLLSNITQAVGLGQGEEVSVDVLLNLLAQSIEHFNRVQAHEGNQTMLFVDNVNFLQFKCLADVNRDSRIFMCRI